MSQYYPQAKINSAFLYKMLYELYGKFDGTPEFREVEKQIEQIEEQKKELTMKETDEMFKKLRDLNNIVDVNPSKYESLAEEMNDEE